MNRTALLAAGLLAMLPGCRRDPEPPPNRPDHALLRGLPAPPTNAPLQVPVNSQRSAPVQLPAGRPSALIVLRAGRPFTGALDLAGRLTITADRIRLEPAGDSTIELLYRLPPDMPPLRADSATGSLVLVERSGPGRAARWLLLRSAARPLLAETWQIAEKPVQLELGNGVRLVQQSTRPSAESRYSEAPLVAMEGDRVIARIPIGRPTTIQASAGRWVVFTEVSHLLTPTPADAGQVEGGYILRAWAVAGN